MVLTMQKVEFLEVDNDVEAKKQQISKQAELTTDVIQHWQQKKKKTFQKIRKTSILRRNKKC